MATKKVGALIKEARTAAKLTQEKLAKAAGVTANDIGKCERGEIDLSAAQLKKIAVACGVTQTSLVNAPKNLSAAGIAVFSHHHATLGQHVYMLATSNTTALGLELDGATAETGYALVSNGAYYWRGAKGGLWSDAANWYCPQGTGQGKPAAAVKKDLPAK